MEIDWNRLVKDVAGSAILGIVGCYSLYLGKSELAGVCFGALVTWILKNGYALKK